MKKFAQWVGVLVLGLTVVGCATLLGGGGSQDITVNANVAGAEVALNGVPLGTTPLTVNISRKTTGLLTISSEGYQTLTVGLERTTNGWFWGNILSGGLLGSSTDYATGAMYKYEPSTYFVSLQEVDQTSAQMNDWRKRESLRSFVLLNSEALVSDLATGDGEYVDVLIDALAVAPEGRSDAIERWRASYVASRTVADFAERMVAELG